MQIRGVKIWIVLIAFVVVLAALLGGTYLVNKFNVERPLLQMYSDIKEVDSVQLNSSKKGLEIVVKFKQTPNLQRTYQELIDGTKEVLGERPFKIIVKDQRTEELEELYSDGQLIIYESLVRGNFSEMAKDLEEIASKNNAEVKVAMNEEHIFIQFHKGNKFLYEIVNWHDEKAGNGIGSDKNVEGS